MADHLINVLKSSGTAEVLEAVVSTLPACTDWGMGNSAATPTPVPSRSGENTIGTSQTLDDQSYSADDTLHGREIIINSSDMSLIEAVTRCVSSDTGMRIIVENSSRSGPTSAMKSSGLNSMTTEKRYDAENVPLSHAKQSNGQQTTSTSPIAPHQSNQLLNKPRQNISLQQVREPEPTATSDQAVNVQQMTTSVPKDTSHKLPSPAATSTAVTLAISATRSNATPLDNPILPGTVSSRSTSSRKRSHIRILDFGTPAVKRGSPSTVGRPSPLISSPALHSVPKRAVLVQKQPTPATNQGYINSPGPPPLPPPPPPAAPPLSIPNDKLKPKKVIVKRRIIRSGVRRQDKRIISTKLYPKRLVATIIPKSIEPPQDNPQPTGTTDTTEPINLSKRCDYTSARKFPTITNLPPSFRPASTSPPRSVVPGSPTCPIDPLALCPMTPRFLTRPLQPLCMLTPVLGTLDLSGISHVKSLSHSKPATDINTPRYPITPGNAITPSPERSVSYYEGETTSNERTTAPADNHRSDGSPGTSKQPLLTLTANSEEIVIRYDEKASLPLRVRNDQHEREVAAQLAARIEIDDGNGKVFQIAVSPLMELYKDHP
uniref:Wiskott-Aldrich syndrome protein family member n=1 Tax=Anopheles maculatus TaxID=74869 RepID=A0A182SZ17_9DIPT